jgi:hypothetical protein
VGGISDQKEEKQILSSLPHFYSEGLERVLPNRDMELSA